jgi:hypothetical protein
LFLLRLSLISQTPISLRPRFQMRTPTRRITPIFMLMPPPIFAAFDFRLFSILLLIRCRITMMPPLPHYFAAQVHIERLHAITLFHIISLSRYAFFDAAIFAISLSYAVISLMPLY